MFNRSVAVRVLIGVFSLSLIASPITFAASGANNGVPGELDQIKTLLTQVLTLLTPPPPPPPVAQNKTRLLYPFVTNVQGFDTGIAVSNTGVDSTGTVGISGTATIYFFGINAPAPVSTGVIAAGTTYTTLVSLIAPGYNGYVEVVCNFPFAHGFGFLSDLGARNLAATIPALVLPLQRTNTSVESVGQ
jgi:hypothetical protein